MNAFFKLLIAWYWKRRENELWWMESEDGPRFVPLDLVLWMAPWAVLACVGWYCCWSWAKRDAEETQAELVRYLQAARQTGVVCHVACPQQMKSQGTPDSPPGVHGAARSLVPGR